LERVSEEACPVIGISARLTSYVHIFSYGTDLWHLLKGKWDVVHAWEEPFILAGWQISRWAPQSARLIYRTAQNLPKHYPLPFSWFERSSMQRASGWICSGRSVHDNLSHRPGYSLPSLMSPLGVDPEVFHPDPSLGAFSRRRLGWHAAGPPVVGFVGRFVPEKGLRMLMRALDQISAPWRALFLGGGPMDREVAAWAERYGDRVRVLRVSHAAVAQHLNAMDLLCVPSQTTARWREQFGRVLIEAFACGLPVVGSDSGEIANILNGVGRVIPEQDETSWVAQIAELVESPRLRAELGARGLDAARTHYTWPVIARQYIEFFEGVLGS
jgi:glycosyltransferase involved in cell wall biosynthesis